MRRGRAWRTFVIGFALSLLPMVAQSQQWLERRSTVYDYVIGGRHFQVPDAYMQPTAVPGAAVDDSFHFSFWVSDGKPGWMGMHHVPESARVGRTMFWPPEPGRPFFNVADFLVQV